MVVASKPWSRKSVSAVSRTAWRVSSLPARCGTARPADVLNMFRHYARDGTAVNMFLNEFKTVTGTKKGRARRPALDPCARGRSVDDFTRLLAPLEVGFLERDETHAGHLRVGARRAARDLDLVADLQGLLIHAGPSEVGRAGPLDGIAAYRPVLLHDVHLDKGVRIAKLELHQLALNRDPLILFVGRGKRVVCGQRRAGANEGRHSNGKHNQVTLHNVVPP